jgi:hypothetical protein
LMSSGFDVCLTGTGHFEGDGNHVEKHPPIM